MRRQLCAVVLVTVLATWVVSAGPVATVAKDTAGSSIELLMPAVRPQVVDTYLCHGMKMGSQTLYLTGFQPHASMDKVHHILIYGCSVPGSDNGVWDCGEMHANSPAYETAGVCGSNAAAKIIYAWAMDAPELHLPKDVAFKVGGDSDIKWLVLQVHYKDVTLFTPPNNQTDSSGVSLLTSNTPLPKLAGVYLLGTGGQLPPHSTTYMETACSYDQPVVMHPFAFRTHAHTHGRVVAGYRVRGDQWTEIGRMSPQKPQMFYNVTTPGVTVSNGDILAARCTMVNDEDRTIKVGSTGNDEMCNFYIMYYVDGSKPLSENYCFTAGPPNWYWDDMAGLDVAGAPLTASIIPGSDDVIEATNRILEDMDERGQRMEKMFGQLLQEPVRTRSQDFAGDSAYERLYDAEPIEVNERSYNYFDDTA